MSIWHASLLVVGLMIADDWHSAAKRERAHWAISAALVAARGLMGLGIILKLAGLAQ